MKSKIHLKSKIVNPYSEIKGSSKNLTDSIAPSDGISLNEFKFTSPQSPPESSPLVYLHFSPAIKSSFFGHRYFYHLCPGWAPLFYHPKIFSNVARLHNAMKEGILFYNPNLDKPVPKRPWTVNYTN